MEEKRQIFRLTNMDLPCKYGNCSEGETQIVDLSETGARLDGQLCDVGSPITISFKLFDKAFNRTGVVVWSDEQYTVIRFVNISSSDESELLKSLFQKEIRRRNLKDEVTS